MSNGKVIVRLFGGLGNQMFIYAAGKSLALRNDSEFIIDYTTGFKGDIYKRHFELDNFNITAKFTSKVQCFDYKGGSYIRHVSNKIGRHIPLLNIKIIKENNFEFNNNFFLNKNKNCLLEGYWQTERYFMDYSDIIKKDFLIIKGMSYSVNNEAKSIDELGDRTIALGVRRYQEVKTFVNIKLTDKEYYLQAMKIMAQKVKDPIFICFTQDPNWVEENLCQDFDVRFAIQKDQDSGAIEDLFLIRRCKHFIISNSTFYWWGAWLAENKNKIVITPNNWVNQDTAPPDWTVLSEI